MHRTALQANRRTVHGALEELTEAAPDALLVRIVRGPDYSRREILQKAKQVAAALDDAGVRRGDMVGMMVTNRIEFITVWFGALFIGAVPAPLHTSFKGDILANLLRVIDPMIMFVDDSVVESAAPALREIRYSKPLIVIGSGDVGDVEHIRFDKWIERDPFTKHVEIGLNDICTVLYSSGTTGSSKGALWPHRAVYALAADWAMLGNYGDGDLTYTATPFFHGLALTNGLLASMIVGGGCVLAERYSVSRFWSDCIETGATKTALLGEMATHLWNREPSDIEHQHRVNAAFVAPRPVDTFDAFEKRFGFKIYGAFANTDSGGLAMWVGLGEGNPRAVGRPSPYWETALVDDGDVPVPLGEPGELVVRPREPFLGTQGYVGMPEASHALVRNCWYHTGDILRRDEEGWHYFVDRKKDSMRRGGENISTFEVEQALLGHPGVLQVAVFGVPSELSEDDVMASLVLRPGVSLAVIGDYAESRLPYYAVPRYYNVVDKMPLTVTGKVLKVDLKREGVTPTTWDRGRTRRVKNPLGESSS